MSRQYAQPGQAAGPDKFLSEENRRMLYGILSKDFIKRGVTLTPRLADQLDQYLNHYVDEVYSVQGTKPITFLNKEVLVTTAQEFTNSVLKKAPAAAPAPPAQAQAQVQAQVQQTKQVITAVRATGKPTTTGLQGVPDNASAGTPIDSLFMDTSSRFDALQKERMEVKKAAPPMPEFKIDFSDDGPSPMELYERAKKAREEALAAVQQSQQERSGAGASTPVDVFVPAETYAPRVTAGPMNEFLDSIATSSRDKGIATSSPNLVTPVDNNEKILSQQVVIKDDDVVNYKEVENNLIIYSADRDWVNNATDNRYNFSVNFDPANNKQGFGLSPASNMKFKNIVRIEFIKAILPAEGLDVIIRQDASGTPTYSTNINANALSFPYLTLHIDEYRGNNYGTDNHLDNAFAVLQYDAVWTMDTVNNNNNRGYIAFIPKNLKAQRVWMPTPLATLTRLSLRIERPDGTPLQTNLDTSVINRIYSSANALTIGSTFYTAAGAAARYLFIRTTKYFSKFAVQVGDRILFKDFVSANATYPEAATQLNTFINQETGHLVVGVAYDPTGSGVGIVDGSNIVGYANYIIIESRMSDPTTGLTTVDPFGGTATINNNFLDSVVGTTTYTGNCINLNRQTQFVFRVITREMDAASRLRPDNLN